MLPRRGSPGRARRSIHRRGGVDDRRVGVRALRDRWLKEPALRREASYQFLALGESPCLGYTLRDVKGAIPARGGVYSAAPVVHWSVIRPTLVTSLLALLLLAGCHSGRQISTETATSPSYKVYKLRGKVVSTNSTTGEVTLDHQAIPGFMEAMTMPYKLKDPGILSELHQGDVITADVLVSQEADASVLLDHIVIVAQGKPDYKPAAIYHVPAPGDQVPDFALRNQDGRVIHLDQFRGRELLITFIYTRCPLPNFCPLVTRNFAAIEKKLTGDPKLYGKTHLLSVSFDPDHDTPERLRAYGAEYIGSDAKSTFAHWDFAVPQKPVLIELAKYFDVGMTPGEDNTINHTLSTTLIGRDGRVVRFYPGNEWTPEQVLNDLRQAANGA